MKFVGFAIKGAFLTGALTAGAFLTGAVIGNLVKKENVNHKDLFYMREDNIYFYSNGWNYKAIYSLLIGFIFSFSILWNYNLQDIKTFSWIIGFLVSFVLYYLLSDE